MLSSISFLFDTYWALGMTLFPSIPFWSPHSAVMTLIAVAAVSFLAGKIAGTFCGGPSANPLDPVQISNRAVGDALAAVSYTTLRGRRDQLATAIATLAMALHHEADQDQIAQIEADAGKECQAVGRRLIENQTP